MIQLTNTLNARFDSNLKQVFIQEVMQLPLEALPLQRALQAGSHALRDNLQIMLNQIINDRQDFMIIRAGIFYSSVVAGCNCADDPSPVDLVNEYCELSFSIDTDNGNTTITLID